MSDVRKQVENYLIKDRTLLGGRNLYNKLPGKNLAIQQAFSRMTNTAENLEIMCYELAKLAAIPERNFKILMQKEADRPKPAPSRPRVTATPLGAEDKLMVFITEGANYNAAKSLLKALNIKAKSRKKADVFKALEDARKELVSKKFQELPDDVKASIKLRDQFPFFRETDCPDVLKLLINDLITAYETFRHNQPKLHDLMTAKEAKAIVDTVKDNYITNKKAFEELEYYKKTNTLLGKHPLFERIALKDEISALTTEKLTKKISTLKANITRNTQKENKDLVERDTDLLEHANGILSKR